MSTSGGTQDNEPDYRFTLANERTFLAWMRTCLATLAAAVAFVQLTPGLGPQWLRVTCGVFLAVLATITAVGGLLRWRRVEIAMRQGQPLPSEPIAWVVATGFGVIAVVIAIVIALEALQP